MTAAELLALPAEKLHRILVADLMTDWSVSSDGSYCIRYVDTFGRPSKGIACYPLTDHNDAALCLAEIERRGLGLHLTSCLFDLVVHHKERDQKAQWAIYHALIKATAQQKTVAAIMAVRSSKGAGK